MLKQLFVASLLLSLIGCGGGGGGSSNKSTAPAPVVNNPPVANDDAIDVGMNVSTTLDLLANDTDKDAFSLSANTEPSSGTLIITDDNIVYTPNDGFEGSDSFTYTIQDTASQEATATVTITVANIPPNAQNDQANTEQSQTIEIYPLANDVSAGGHALTITSISVPSNGSVTHNGEVITYVPNTAFAGEDSFIYVVEDSHGDETTATILVNIDNVIPSLIDDEQSISQNESVTVDVLANDSDAFGDHLTITAITGASHGSAVIDGNKITYTPTLGYAGNETLTYTAEDTYQAEQQASLTITVNNVLPVANDDSVYLKIDESIDIDVLANDQDVIHDTLTIQSVSAPQHGSVTIVDGKIHYQPNAGYEGDDSFGYTLVDSHGASDSGFVTVKVTDSILLSGKLVGYEKAGLTVSVTVDGTEVTTTTDAQGNYSVEIGVITPESIVIASVDNAASNYQLKAYLGSLANLVVEAEANNNIFEDINITDLTTAEYELVNLVLEGREATSQTELISARYDANNYHQMRMAIAVRLVNANNGLNLPQGFDSVNTFMRSTTEMNKQLARWRDEESTTYHAAFESLIRDIELSSFPERLTDDEHLLSESYAIRAHNYSAGKTVQMSLSGNNANYVTNGVNSGIKQTINNRLRIDFNESIVNYTYLVTYCDYSSYASAYWSSLNLLAVEFIKIYSTSEYDVYLQKLEVEIDWTPCNFKESIEYNTVRHYHDQTFKLTSGDYVLNKIKMQDEGTDQESFSYAIASVKLNSDGSFVDADEQDGDLSGTWSNDDNVVSLYYDNGETMIYQKIADDQGYPQLKGTYSKNGEIKYALNSTIFSPSNFSWPYSTGYLLFDLAPIFDPVLNEQTRYNFNNDSTAFFQWKRDGEWQEPQTIYGWEILGNRYVMDSYRLDFQSVDYCDVSLENCYLYQHREMEIIGGQDGIYQVKVRYQRYNNEGELVANSSYVDIVRFIPK